MTSFNSGARRDAYRVSVVRAVEISPHHVARLEIRRLSGRAVAVALGGARVGELEFSAPDDGFGGVGIFRVVEIAQHNQFRVWVRLEMFVNDAAQNFRLGEPLLGLVDNRRWQP